MLSEQSSKLHGEVGPTDPFGAAGLGYDDEGDGSRRTKHKSLMSKFSHFGRGKPNAQDSR